MPQEFIILVSASPLKTQSHLTAIQLITELIQQGFTIRSVFFYQDAVLVANRFSLPPSDEPQLKEHWQALNEQYNISLQTCVAASFRRGIVDNHLAKEQDFECDNLQPGFTVAGLGQLAAAMSDANIKLIQFK